MAAHHPVIATRFQCQTPTGAGPTSPLFECPTNGIKRTSYTCCYRGGRGGIRTSHTEVGSSNTIRQDTQRVFL
jgi:hypothetical protein